jgi:hypothetical protein
MVVNSGSWVANEMPELELNFTIFLKMECSRVGTELVMRSLIFGAKKTDKSKLLMIATVLRLSSRLITAMMWI